MIPSSPAEYKCIRGDLKKEVKANIGCICYLIVYKGSKCVWGFIFYMESTSHNLMLQSSEAVAIKLF